MLASVRAQQIRATTTHNGRCRVAGSGLAYDQKLLTAAVLIVAVVVVAVLIVVVVVVVAAVVLLVVMQYES